MKSLLTIATVCLAVPGIAAPATAADEQKAEKKICKATQSTSTRLSRNRVCLTRAEWNKRDQEFKEELGREMRKGDIKNLGPSGD